MLPKVSVGLITYNHEAYIRQCLDSILMQKVDFEYEIVVGEDKSTDKTLSILLEYQQKHPEKIFILTPTRNEGIAANIQRIVKACRGEYIALIDGDDFCTSDCKLQKQTAFLDLHTQYAMCFHKTDVKYEEQGAGNVSWPTFKDGAEFTVREVILGRWFIPPPSMMIRRKFLVGMAGWASATACQDMALALTASMHGSIGYINETLGSYRVHAKSISQNLLSQNVYGIHLALIAVFNRFNEYSQGKYWPDIKIRLGRIYMTLMRESPFMSAIYLRAMAGLIGLGPAQIKPWIISLLPQHVYKKYSSTKALITGKA